MKAMEKVREFWKDESGLETVEYAVLAALLVAGLVGTVIALGDQIKAVFEGLKTAITP